MYKYFANPSEVKQIQDRVSRYKYGYLRKLQPFCHLSYCRLSIAVRSDKITYHVYADILQACDKFERKFAEYVIR